MRFSSCAIFIYLCFSMLFKSNYHCLASLSLFFAFSFRVLLFSPGVPPFSLVLVPMYCTHIYLPLSGGLLQTNLSVRIKIYLIYHVDGHVLVQFKPQKILGRGKIVVMVKVFGNGQNVPCKSG